MKEYTKQKGAAIFIVLFLFITVSVILVGGLVSPLNREFQSARHNLTATQSYYAAEAGNEDVFYRVKNSMILGSTEELIVGGATTTISIIDVGDSKEISASSSFMDRVRKVKTLISASSYDLDLDYGVFSGGGGVDLSNNVTIQGTGGMDGDIYSNGPIYGANNLTVTGDVISASDLEEDTVAQSIVCNEDQITAKTHNEIDFAQSFIPSETKSLAKVSLYIKKNTSNPRVTKLRITADNGGEPADSALATQAITESDVGTSYGWFDVNFSNPPSLTQGQTYWIVWDGKQKSSKYWYWCKDSSEGYADGEAMYSDDWDDDSWNTKSGDMMFKTYLGTGVGLIDGVEADGDAKANTINDSDIHGDAYYQNISSTDVDGTEYPGSPDPPPLEMPIPDSEVDGWKADAEAGGVINGNCPAEAECSLSMGPVKIDGNLSVSNNKTFNVEGTVYVTGNISLSNNVTIKCDVSYGSNGCIVIADGSISLSNNGVGQGSGDPDSFIMFVSMKSGSNAINIQNNASAVVLYAPYGEINISNNGGAAVAMGYDVNMSNNSTITFEPELLDLSFISEGGGGGGGTGWTINSWREVE